MFHSSPTTKDSLRYTHTQLNMMRRSSLTAVVALRQLGRRSAQAQAQAPALAKAAVDLSSSDLSFTAPSMLIQQKIGKSPVAAAQVACTSTHNPAHPALLAAQAKDAALLSKVADDFLRAVGANWEIEFTNIRYAESLPAGKPFVLDTDYLASLSLARGASFSH